ncbi:phosphotransferase [Amycolatopsis sp. NPDC051372]|uniref:phosphotransferase n=1 Tax=unclassified Amycolatopsis TaxID=2618356 RepID=UPI00343E2952
MPRSSWDDLPASVRVAIEREAGLAARIELPTAGRNSDFSATLHTERGEVFCKGISDAEGSRGRMHRHEADINEWLPPAIAPRLRWRTEADEWLLLGFDHVRGHHADLSPGSPDLDAVADTVTILTTELANSAAPAPRLAEQWARLAPWRRLAKDPTAVLDDWTREHLDQLITWEARSLEAADGDDLLHTDLHSLNMLIDQRAVVIDWAWSRKGAAPVDVAFLLARLVAARHGVEEADRWCEAIPVWRSTSAEVRTALAVEIWGIWLHQSISEPRSLWDSLVPAASQVAKSLLCRT